MKCPNCGKETLVEIEKKDNDTYISRTYECSECKKKVTSVEELRISKRKTIS